LAYQLQETGVRDYFVVPGIIFRWKTANVICTDKFAIGDFHLNLLDQLLKNQALHMVGCCNELNAGYAADGYARSSPAKVAVVMVTFMVGGLSIINAIAGAYSDHLRVVVISGCPRSETFVQDRIIHHTLGITDRDQALRMFKEVTTASVRLDRDEPNPASLLEQILMRCVQESLPVYIEISSDLAEMPCKPPGPWIRQVPKCVGKVIFHLLWMRFPTLGGTPLSRC
jgi:pyruvate decarboxylase